MKRSRKGVSAAISIAILLPVVAMTSMLVLNLYLQSTASQQAAVRQAELAAEEGKKYLRLSALRGPANETLINLYGAGKLPITVDYILVQLQNDTILVDRGGNILTVNPGENITLTPSQLDPRLAPYDLNYWTAKREIKQFILHTSDGNSLHLSWGPWGGMVAATYSTNTATTITSSTTTTTTITQTGTVNYVVRMASTTTSTSYIGVPDRTTTVYPPPVIASARCNAEARYSYIVNDYRWTSFSISCSTTIIQGGAPPYSVTITSLCTISGTTSSTSFSGSCSTGLTHSGRELVVRRTLTVRDSSVWQWTWIETATCYFLAGGQSGTVTTTC